MGQAKACSIAIMARLDPLDRAARARLFAALNLDLLNPFAKFPAQQNRS